jgi:hypothetical protein
MCLDDAAPQRLAANHQPCAVHRQAPAQNAPLGPSNPKHCPAWRPSDKSCTATLRFLPFLPFLPAVLFFLVRYLKQVGSQDTGQTPRQVSGPRH